MIYSFDIINKRRANIWLDEAPPASFSASSIETRIIVPRISVKASRAVAVVEACFLHGPRASYALLGAEITPRQEEDLRVMVSVNSVGPILSPSLALNPDTITVGLPHEFVGAVFAGVEEVAQSIGAPSRAVLHFRWAAHGVVGSSSAVFAKLSKIVVQLLTFPPHTNREDIVALFT